jgi:alcohol dehydrogenase class IV
LPERHHRVAELLAARTLGEPGPDTLSDVFLALARDVGAPRGVAAFGYRENDIPALVAGALKQRRLLAGAPRPVGEQDLHHIITASLANW